MVCVGAWKRPFVCVLGGLTLLGLSACGRSIERRGDDDDDDDNSGGENASGGTGGSSGSNGSSGKSGLGGKSGFGGKGSTPHDPPDAPELGQQATKLDLLLMIDGSLWMSEKQRLLAGALPQLLQELTAAASDIHIGVISSNLGDHGSRDVCSDATGGRTPDDHAQLIPTVRSGVPFDDPMGFLTWQPDSDPTTLAENLRAQIQSVGELGCGYEGSLEAWYRFLIDPEPVTVLDNDGQNSVRQGTNLLVLEQRASFLRPDSLVAIVMLTDENDCSILDENHAQGWLVGFKGGVQVNNWRMPAATASCANPNDPCCRPCIIGPAPGCGDNVAEGCPESSYHALADDSMNLRCFRQRERFGIDWLYPVSRYVEALTKTEIDPRLNGDYVQNRLFVSEEGELRGRDNVLLAGILGVPWQDIATAESLEDLETLRFLDSSELAAQSRWDIILGDPENGVPPADPLMVESIDPRPPAEHPLVDGAAIRSPGDTDWNVINGREQQVLPDSRDDLQFACIFPIEAMPCDATNAAACNCNADEYAKESPLCRYTTPNEDGMQVNAKAYPSVRPLQVLKGVGTQGLVTSICPRHFEGGTDDPDYGYNPALAAIAAHLKQRLATE